jgi:Flp pilus assembly protein TadD
MNNMLNQQQVQNLFAEGAHLLHTGNAAEALTRFQTLEPLCSGNTTLLLYKGTSLHELGRYEEAASAYYSAINLNPQMGEAHNNLGNSLMALGRFADAVSCFSQATRLLPSSPVPLTALATAQQACGQVAEAEISCRAARAISPDFADAHWNLALNLLLQGHYTEGWLEYEWRWKKTDFTSPLRHTDIPQWDGSTLNGRTILLHAEQGFGDAIQFVRYVELVAQRGGRILLECHPALVPLFQEIEWVETVIPFGLSHQVFSCQAALLSLPRILGTTLETIPVKVPYLKVDSAHREKWAALTSPYSTAMRIGLIWSGKSYPDPLRSCPFCDLAPLYTLNGFTFFSLQVETPFAETHSALIDLTKYIHDFADSAALIDQLDVVVSIDTAGAHLAAALGKPVCLLVPFAPDWRWLLDRKDSPWYPTMHLFRQERPGEWGPVVKKISDYLQRMFPFTLHKHM